MTDTLSEIFARDPFTLTRDSPEIETMVTHLRAQRHQFKLQETTGVKTPKAPSGRKPKMSKEEADAALRDLNLDLGL